MKQLTFLVKLCLAASLLSLFNSTRSYSQNEVSGGVVLQATQDSGLTLTLRKLSAASGEASRRSYELKITGAESAQPFTAAVFALTDPARLVVDLSGVGGSGTRTLKLHESVLAAMRIGRYKEKVRLVIDLNEKEAPEFSFFPKDPTRSLVVKFFAGKVEVGESSAEPPPQLSSSLELLSSSSTVTESSSLPAKPEIVTIGALAMSSTPVSSIEPPSPAPSSSSSSSSLSLSLPSPSPSPPPSSSSAEEKTIAAIAASSIVRGIKFQGGADGQGGLVGIELSVPVHYRLARVQDNLYELELEGARPQGSHLELPHFPPDNLDGVQLVTAKSRSNNTVIQIYVDDGVKLKPYTSQGMLWVSVNY